jgi:hypothetical protein
MASLVLEGFTIRALSVSVHDGGRVVLARAKVVETGVVEAIMLVSLRKA